MEKQRLEVIKLGGIAAELIRTIDSELWLIRQAGENSKKDNMKNILLEMDKIKNSVVNVECLHTEYIKTMSEIEKINNSRIELTD